MTSPNIPIPDGAYVPGSGFGQQYRGMTLEDAKKHVAMPVQGAFAGIDGFLPSLIKMFTGTYEGPHQAFHDGQIELNKRIELLQDVSGYGTAYMSANHYLRRRRWEPLPFDEQVGPEKGVAFDGQGLILTKGTWVLNALATHDHHVDRRESILRLEVQDRAGNPWSRKEDYGEVFPSKYTTRQVPHTVVIPEDGYRVRVFSYYSVGTALGVYNKLRWLGGTNLSHLSAFRLNTSTANAVGMDGSLPDVGDPEGDDG